MAKTDTSVADVAKILAAAAHALRSYEHGNGSPDLAKAIADEIDAVLG